MAQINAVKNNTKCIKTVDIFESVVYNMSVIGAHLSDGVFPISRINRVVW